MHALKVATDETMALDVVLKVFDFQELLKKYDVCNHPLFAILNQKASEKTISTEAYSLFCKNFALRTVLTLPQIFTSNAHAALDRRFIASAYGGVTGAEESGSGKPENVHSKLMMEAMNYHGQIAHGMPNINLEYLLDLTKTVFYLEQYILSFYVDSLLQDRLKVTGAVNFSELKSYIADFCLDSVVKLFYSIDRYIVFAQQRGKMLSFWRIWWQFHASA